MANICILIVIFINLLLVMGRPQYPSKIAEDVPRTRSIREAHGGHGGFGGHFGGFGGHFGGFGGHFGGFGGPGGFGRPFGGFGGGRVFFGGGGIIAPLYWPRRYYGAPYYW